MKENNKDHSVKTEDIEKRMERLNKYIKVVDDAMEQMMTERRENGELSYLSENELQEMLRILPNFIADASLINVKLARDVEYAKLDSLIEKHKLSEEARRLNISTQKEREAYALTNPGYHKTFKIEIEYRYRLGQAKVIQERYENLFVSCRKLANLIEKDNMNNYRREKYE